MSKYMTHTYCRRLHELLNAIYVILNTILCLKIKEQTNKISSISYKARKLFFTSTKLLNIWTSDAVPY